MKINIAGGSGIMGQVHKPIFERAGHQVIISGRNSSPSLEEAAGIADVTIVSVPIPNTEEIIRRVGPYCRKAIMDFTSVKTYPVQWMLGYATRHAHCEVAGLHPLYGDVDSIKGRTIVYCKTERTGKRCGQVVEALKSAGGAIVELDPEKHDLMMEHLQNLRVKLLEAFALSVKRVLDSSTTPGKNQFSIQEVYALAPPPTKILLDLIARQVNPKTDGMYWAMREFNPYKGISHSVLEEELEDLKYHETQIPGIIRKMFGEELKTAQERAKKLI